jgi:hypothetical protein
MLLIIRIKIRSWGMKRRVSDVSDERKGEKIYLETGIQRINRDISGNWSKRWVRNSK